MAAPTPTPRARRRARLLLIAALCGCVVFAWLYGSLVLVAITTPAGAPAALLRACVVGFWLVPGVWLWRAVRWTSLRAFARAS